MKRNPVPVRLALSFALVCALAAPVCAANFGYNGSVNNDGTVPSLEQRAEAAKSAAQSDAAQGGEQTDTVQTETELEAAAQETLVSQSVNENGEVWLNKNELAYDAEKGVFVYYIGGAAGDRLTCTLLSGTATTDTVTFEMPMGVTLQAYVNGDLAKADTVGTVTTPGSYRLIFTGSDRQSQLEFDFYIVTDPTNVLTSLSLPAGVSFSQVLLDNQPLRLTSANAIDFSSDGLYELHYGSESAGLNFVQSYQIDRTPPTLALAEVVNGVADGPVSLADAEPGSTLQILHNGSEMSPPLDKRLTTSGRYTVRVTDTAGNSTEYSFAVSLYFSLTTFLAITMLLAAVAGLWVYARYMRKHLRVR